MTQFKKGDFIKVIKDHFNKNSEHINRIGIVTCVEENEKRFPVCVKFIKGCNVYRDDELILVKRRR